ncbi:MAG: hypothetical protein KQJ78_24205 [Deltaproteobacteria bacterium]|nr:hypothetical protein [Deltaproteobacteria bacterium]
MQCSRYEIGLAILTQGTKVAGVVFDLGVATLLTLVVVPVLCSLQDSAAAWVAGRGRGKREKKKAVAEGEGVRRQALSPGCMTPTQPEMAK